MTDVLRNRHLPDREEPPLEEMAAYLMWACEQVNCEHTQPEPELIDELTIAACDVEIVDEALRMAEAFDRAGICPRPDHPELSDVPRAVRVLTEIRQRLRVLDA
jgi:hypothetical protein